MTPHPDLVERAREAIRNGALNHELLGLLAAEVERLQRVEEAAQELEQHAWNHIPAEAHQKLRRALAPPEKPEEEK